jgi:hypothetical protein
VIVVLYEVPRSVTSSCTIFIASAGVERVMCTGSSLKPPVIGPAPMRKAGPPGVTPK